ncbi:MAG: sugar phosphate isomerase/epimerase [Firmicutes bacterium]|nr:sugar phosphate isomerase/epimerase [Bacillota bacterium]
MRLGLYHTAMLDLEPEALMLWLQQHEFSDLELHGGPRYRGIDWSLVAQGDASLRDIAERYGIKIWDIMDGSLNFLDADRARRQMAIDHAVTLIRAAAVLGAASLSVFTGRDPLTSIDQNLERLPDALEPILTEADKRGIQIGLENCPMAHEWPPRFNIAISPRRWRDIFARIPSPVLGLNFDPSHLVWQGIDYVAAVHEFGSRIILAQVKDSERIESRVRDEGILDTHFWRHRIPGQGDIDWMKLVSALVEVGYQRPLFIEQEDPFFEGSLAKAEAGIEWTRRYLAPCLAMDS